MEDERKTKEQLIAELVTLREHVAKLARRGSERKRSEARLQSTTRELRERVKELDCLYGIADLVERPGIPLEGILQGTVALIPGACLRPENVCARITVEGQEFRTSGFRETPRRLASSIVVREEQIGIVEVYHLAETPRHEEQLVTAKKALFKAIAERLGRIIERKQAEEQARRQREQLMQADKMVALGTLVSGIGHEINNPNNFILLNVPFLKGAWESALAILDTHYRQHGDFRLRGVPFTEAREILPQLLDDIRDGARRIKRIVDELKDYARPQETRLDEQVDINKVVQSAVTLSHPFIRKRTQAFSAEYAKDIPRLRGSAQRIEQVVINLLQNACEALQDARRGVSVRTAADTDGQAVTITVCDEGEGVSEENLRRITDPFFTTKRDSGGTGLGLSISARIVQDHGGSLRFNSTVGEGTVATVSLPTVPREEDGGKQ
jgi:signal transduction histidine kinase